MDKEERLEEIYQRLWRLTEDLLDLAVQMEKQPSVKLSTIARLMGITVQGLLYRAATRKDFPVKLRKKGGRYHITPEEAQKILRWAEEERKQVSLSELARELGTTSLRLLKLSEAGVIPAPNWRPAAGGYRLTFPPEVARQIVESWPQLKEMDYG